MVQGEPPVGIGLPSILNEPLVLKRKYFLSADLVGSPLGFDPATGVTFRQLGRAGDGELSKSQRTGLVAAGRLAPGD